jgi:hypothetical protein
MALSADTPRAYGSGVEPTFTSLPCTSNVTIYEGSAVGESSSPAPTAPSSPATLRGLRPRAGRQPGVSGTKRVKVRQKGIVRLTVAACRRGRRTATRSTPRPTARSPRRPPATAQIGKVVQWITGTTCDVYFEGLTSARSNPL